jgi:hypothetical protein
MKLAAALVLDQLPAQFVPGFDHEGKALRAPLLDPRLHPMGACGVHDQRYSWHAGTWCAEPPQRIQEADPLHVAVLEHGRVPRDHADEVVDEGKDGSFLQHAWHRLTVQHIHLDGGREVRERGLDPAKAPNQ